MSLIWGEAASLRFCPESLAFMYHRPTSHLMDANPNPNP